MRNKSEIKSAIKDSNFSWLGREPFIEDFVKHLIGQPDSMHVCINGVWGSGKTTTVMGIIDHLDNIFEMNKPLVLYLDSWKYEHYQHPLFALLKVMQSELPQVFNEISDEFQKNKNKPQFGLSLPFINVNMSENKSDPYSRLLSEAEYIDALNECMISVIKEFKKEKSNKMVIFIDELDRAKPDFALRTIEMFHHLQDELPTHIVYSVDMNQLSSIIKHYYGYEYNVKIFTHKVFDEVISLKKLNRREIEFYIDEKIFNLSTSYNTRTLRDLIMKYMKLTQLESLRTINKVCESIIKKLQSSYFLYSKRSDIISKYYLGYESNLWGYVELLVVLEVFSLTDSMKVYEFLRGNKISQLLSFILEHQTNGTTSELEHLIAKSYDDGNNKDNGRSLNYSDLNDEQKIVGLSRLFVPANQNVESIFSSGEIF